MTEQAEDGASGARAAPGRKRIAICCDGTWQRLDSRHPTNPVRLATAVLPRDPRGGTVQLVYHLDGVGTGRGTGGFARAIDRIFGGLMGSGLTETVAEAYRHLVFSYQPGDEIYVFGYSRGAYTARSLVGMIRNCGIVSRGSAGAVREALALYRSTRPEDKPDGGRALAFRAEHAPEVVTGDDEIAWRQRNRPGRDWSQAVPLRVAYVGVWDTVGSLGIPEGWALAERFNRRHRFHDTCLSSRVLSARHAVAIDERRQNFQPALWANVGELNAERGAAGERPYRQEWFPGVHAAVGGGGDDPSLSSLALLWVMKGAERQGLAFDPGVRAEVEEQGDPLGPLSGRTAPAGSALGALLHLGPRDREGPVSIEEVSEAAQRRWALDPGYRPKPFERVRRALEAVVGEAKRRA